VSIFGLDFSLAGGIDKFVTDEGADTKKITLDSYDAPNTVPLVFGVSSQGYYPPPHGV